MNTIQTKDVIFLLVLFIIFELAYFVAIILLAEMASDKNRKRKNKKP